MEKRLRDCNFSFENLHHNRIFADHLEIHFSSRIGNLPFCRRNNEKKEGNEEGREIK
jgi:hypothetical protein